MSYVLCMLIYISIQILHTLEDDKDHIIIVPSFSCYHFFFQFQNLLFTKTSSIPLKIIEICIKCLMFFF